VINTEINPYIDGFYLSILQSTHCALNQYSNYVSHLSMRSYSTIARPFACSSGNSICEQQKGKSNYLDLCRNKLFIPRWFFKVVKDKVQENCRDHTASKHQNTPIMKNICKSCEDRLSKAKPNVQPDSGHNSNSTSFCEKSKNKSY